MDVLRWILFAVGYPVAIVVIVRWVPVVREQRTNWYVAHEAAVLAICLGHLIGDNPRGVIINFTWLLIAAIWYFLGGRRARGRPASG
jgi:hypothetical protein